MTLGMSTQGTPDLSGAADNGYLSGNQANALSGYIMDISRVSEYETQSGVAQLTAQNLTQQAAGGWQLAQTTAADNTAEAALKLKLMGIQQGSEISSMVASAGGRGIGIGSPSNLAVIGQKVTENEMQQNEIQQQTVMTNRQNMMAAFQQSVNQTNQAAIEEYQSSGDQTRAQDVTLAAQLKMAETANPNSWVKIT